MPRLHGDCMFRNEWLKDDKFKTWVANDRTQPQVPQIFIRSRSAILLLSLSLLHCGKVNMPTDYRVIVMKQCITLNMFSPEHEHWYI